MFNVKKFVFSVLSLAFFSQLYALEEPSPPDWMLQQIENDLSYFKTKGITKKILELFYNSKPAELGIFRFQIQDGKVYIEGKNTLRDFQSRSLILGQFFKTIAEKYHLPNVDFLVCLHDSYVPEKEPIPIFVFAKKKNNTQILMPDFDALEEHGNIKEKILKAGKKYPWRAKVEKCFWRGSTTGGDFSSQGWRSYPRTKLVFQSIMHPDQVDARFTTLCQGAENNTDFLETPDMLGQFVSSTDSLKYKYLIDVDGNTCGYSRFYWTLLSNSVVFKQNSEIIQWYYGALKPFEHYIPVANDFKDLIKMIAWARSHDAEAKNIANNATKFALENLNHEDVQLYMYLLLSKYAELF